MAVTSGLTRAIIVLTTITAAIMELLDTTIVNVALNQMAGSLGATIEDVAWVITSYAIANVIIIPMTGFLGEYFGRKNYYLVSIIVFGIASYLCGASSSLEELVLWRFVQGIGGGALLSTSQSILFDAFEPKDRGIASGLFGMGIVMGPTLGPAVGGYILENYHWGQIFDVNIPICIAAAFLTFFFIEKREGEGTKKSEIKIDYLGILLLAAGVGSLQYVLERGESEDWFDSRSIVFLTCVAFFGLIAFVWWQLKIKQPVVNLRVFRYPSFSITVILSFVAGLGLFTSVFVYPVLVQRINGFSPLETGLSLIYPTLVAVFLFPIIGRRLSAGASPLPFMAIGVIMFIIFGFYSGTATADMGRWEFFPMQLLRTVGVAMLQLPLINQAVAGLKPQEYPAGIALTNMVRQLGGAFGIAMANNYITSQIAQHRSDLMGQLTPENPIFTDRLNTLTNGMISRSGDIAQATQMAYKQLELTVMKQAYLLAYLDTFRLVSVFFIAILPLIFLLPRTKKSGVSAAKAAAESH
jgi:MFS transporter, DHA2 family, multidrug resistance protein